MQVPNGTGPGVRRSKRPLLASRTRCNVLWKPPKFGNKVKIGNKVQFTRAIFHGYNGHAKNYISPKIIRIILQSHYPNRRSADCRWAKFLENQATSADVFTDFGWFFWSADAFFVEALKLKVSLTNLSIFMGFVIGGALGDGRPISANRRSTFIRNFKSRYRPNLARSSGVNRPTIARSTQDENFL